MNKFLKLFCVLCFIPLSGFSQSIVPPSDIAFIMPSLTVPRDAAVGTVLHRETDLGSIMLRGIACEVKQEFEVFGTPVPGLNKVFRTNVPGIGVQFSITEGLGGGFVFGPNFAVFTPQYNVDGQQYRRATYVVTGEVSSGVVAEAPYYTVTYSGPCFATKSYRGSIQGGSSVITSHTCSVLTNRVDVGLPDVKASELRNTNATAGETSFSIGLNCTKGSNVYITLTDKNDVSNQSGTLSLDKSSTASGVGVQVLMDQKSVKFGPDSQVAGTLNQMHVGPSDPSLTSIPFTARYISLGNPRAGTVSATATFTMSYQ